ncbi:glycosyltransferase [Psychromonas sp. SA13A]|uniref:glycosyltransferase n=1 Tax=Psychromonas sp. SA13A TaxID=2686346 RepID=UPI0014092FB4|nr:glycosyltransferase [Psychromonas sp. SA13A]
MLKLSVIVPVYNLEKYVEECLLSLLEQKTDFVYEIIVSDDCSTDSSSSIIRDLQIQFPNKLKSIIKTKNEGLAENIRSLLKAVKGQYIAYIDGDDLALPNKLQCQVDYLDEHEKCGMVYHESDVFDSNTNLSLKKYSRDYYNWQYIETKSTVNDLILYGTFLQAGTVMFRNHSRLLESVSERSQIILDYPFYISHAALLGGSIDFIDQMLGRYRIHQDSFGQQTQHSVERRLQSLNDMCYACERASNFGIDESVIQKGVYHHYYSTALYFLKKGNLKQFLDLIIQSTDSMWFFDDKHKFTYQNRLSPSLVYKQLGFK